MAPSRASFPRQFTATSGVHEAIVPASVQLQRAELDRRVDLDRGLQNVLASLTVTGPRYGPIGPDALPSAFRRTVAAERRPMLAEAREDLERAMVRDTLGRHGSVARAAGELGVTRQGLSKLMARLDIDCFNPSRDRSAQIPSR